MVQQTAAPPDTSRAYLVTVRLRRGVGALYMGGAAVHLTLATWNPDGYRPFADGALFEFVRSQWREVFMAGPTAWALILAAGEALLGLALLCGGTAARWGYVAVIGFHIALMLFGWGFWLWSVPALTFLVWLAWRDWPQLGRTRVPAVRDSRP